MKAKSSLHRSIYSLTVTALLLVFCTGSVTDRGTDKTKTNSDDGSPSAEVTGIKLPPGFNISVYAEVPDARSMALSPSGVLYIGNKSEGNVYAVQDTNGDFKADKKWVIAKGLNMPNGVAFRDGDLYVAEVSRILRFRKIESNLQTPPKAEVVYDKFPTDTWHGWKYIAFGPDGKLYKSCCDGL